MTLLLIMIKRGATLTQAFISKPTMLLMKLKSQQMLLMSKNTRKVMRSQILSLNYLMSTQIHKVLGMKTDTGLEPNYRVMCHSL